MTFITAYCLNCSILLVDMVVNHIWCPVYKLSCISGMYVCIVNRIAYIGLFIICSIRHSLGVLALFPADKGELLYTFGEIRFLP